MLKAIWAARWYLLLGFLVFIVTLAATTPLHFVWKYAEPYSRSLPVNIQRVSGTLWHGQAQLQAPQIGALELDWQLSPLALLAAQADLQLQVRGNGLELQTNAVLTASQQLTLTNARGSVSSALLEPMLRRGRASLAGEFEVNALAARIQLAEKRIDELDGQIIFSGGDVGFPVDGKPIQAQLPLLVGQLQSEQDKSVVNIETQEGLPIGQAFLQQDGWGGVAIRRRFLDILGQRWPAEATEETVIFEVSQKIL